MISSDSDDFVHSDDADLLDGIKNSEGVIKVFTAGQIHKALARYKGKKLDKLDKRLLKGFYTTNRLELIKDPNKDLLNCKGGHPLTLAKLITEKVVDSPIMRMKR